MNLKAKKQNGITMVALVVTIIVLIILASIGIAVLTGDDGIINQGKEAKDETEINEEKQIIEISTVQAMERNVFGYIEEENLEKALNENIGKRDEKYKLEETPNGNFVVTIIESNREYTVVQDGEVLIGRQDPENPTPGGGTGGSGEESGGGTTPDPTPEDTTPPTVTVQVTGKTSSYITIEVTATDDTAMPTTPKYTYYIKKSTDNSYIQKSTNNTSSTYTFGSLNPETSYDIQVQVADSAGNKGAGKIENIKTEALPKDETSPTVVVANTGTTSNSISVKVTATDDTAMPTTPTYVYYIKKSTEADTAYVQKASNASDTYTFSGLTTNQSYDIKVQVADNAGNIGEGLLTNIITSSIPDGNTDGTINFGEVIWNNKQASITISTNYTQYKIEYQKNGTTEGNWTEIASGASVSGLLHNDTIYARLTDGINHGAHTSKTIQDTTAPSASVSLSKATSTTLAVQVNATDNESGIKEYAYYIKKSTDYWGSYVLQGTSESPNFTFENLTKGTRYNIQVIVKDKAGNSKTATLTSQSTTSGISGTITFGEPKWTTTTSSSQATQFYFLTYTAENEREGDTTITKGNLGSNSYNTSGTNVAVTVTSLYGHTDYRSQATMDLTKNSYQDILAYADLQLEYISIKATGYKTACSGGTSIDSDYPRFYGRANNFRIGRGLNLVETSTDAAAAGAISGGFDSGTTIGSNSSSGSNNAYKLVVESGKYCTSLGWNQYGLSSNYYGTVYFTLGSDIDRATGNNDDLSVYYRTTINAGGGRNGKYNIRDKSCLINVKSGKFGVDGFEDGNGDIYTSGIYIGGYGTSTGNNTRDLSDRYMIVEGGLIANINCGLKIDSGLTSVLTKLYVKGGEMYNIVGGAGRSTTYGSRILQITGGKVRYSVSGGSNGFSGDDGEGQITDCDTLVYVGGNAQIGDETLVGYITDSDTSNDNNGKLYLVESGCVLGAGNGNNPVHGAVSLPVPDIRDVFSSQPLTDIRY